MSVLVGTRLGPYQIVASLGAGGMGEVYRATDPRLEREVAVKVLPAHLAEDKDALGRFAQEAKAVAALSHPNILSVFDVGAEQGINYMVTELLEGGTLRARLTEGPINEKRVIEIGIAVAAGLSAAQSKGIIHRDLKPENIFLTSDGQVKILDFGLATRPKPKLTREEKAEAPTQTHAGTIAGTVLGTIGYMAPEQVKGEPAGPTSDIFSLGCVLYELVSQRRAFSEPTGSETLAAILRDDPPPLADPEWQRLISHCLEKNPTERFQSARDLTFALRSIHEGTKLDSVAVEPEKKVGRTRRAWMAAAGAGFLALLATVYLVSSQKQSLAVLPFVNLGDANAEYLGDGISENLIRSLSRLSVLRVQSRDSVFPYKNKGMTPQKIGQELHVTSVLTGTVAQHDDALSITVALVDPKNGTAIWKDQYDRRKGDILSIEQEIVAKVSENLGLNLTGEDRKNLGLRSTESAEAHELYMQGRYQWSLRREAALQSSMRFFDQAIEKDPGYALAFAGLADTYNLLGGYGVIDPNDTFPRARAAAERALELDGNLAAEAYAAIGRVKTQYEWDWTGAEEDYKKSIALAPGNGTAHQWYAIHLDAVGRTAEALVEIKLARNAEPLSRIINGNVGWCYYVARQYEQAIKEGLRAIALDPDFAWGHNVLGAVYVQERRYPEAIAELQKAAKASNRGVIELTYLAHAYAISDQKDKARAQIAEFEEMSQKRFVPPEYVAMIYAGLGEKGKALDWLEKAHAQKSMHPFFLPDPRYDILRSDSRFLSLMKRMGLK